ncbi:MAG: hypothetical protein JWN70_211 [Planctomycetaceae bacterium]|nr:hypothetical protein [Planctomycetaceae bacterium]
MTPATQFLSFLSDGATAQRAATNAGEAKDDISRLRSQVDRLQMICEGMWTIMKSRLGVSEGELATLIEQIDLRDGKLDGKAAKQPQMCTECGRVVSVRTTVCLYCGAQNQKTAVF